MKKKREETAQMETKIYCPDIECDGCVNAIRRKMENTKGIDKLTIHKDSFEVSYHKDSLKESDILRMTKKLGFRASLEPFRRKTLKERLRDFKESKQKYEVEYRMMRYSAYTLLLLLALQTAAYLSVFQQSQEILTRYGWWIFYLDIAVVSVGAATWHLKSYRTQVTTMVGMMIGMTFGMQTGLMIGSIIGATNGIFIGGLTGMVTGVAVGFYNGRCCGIMGIMEGMMAGMMNGIMGGMIGVMFYADHILWFMPFFIAINVLIMWGLSLMLFEEVVEANEDAKRATLGFNTFFSWCFVITTLLIIIMMYAPKSGLAAVG